MRSWSQLALLIAAGFMLLRNLMGQQSETLELDALPDDNFQSWVDVSDTYRVGWRVMEDRVRFRVYSSLGGWLGLGVSHEGFMVKPPSVAVVGHSPNTAKVVAQLVLRDMALSAFTPLGSPSLLPGARVASSEGRTVLTFERLIKAADPEDLSLDVIGGDTTFIFAHGESSTPSYHGNTRGNFKANLATGCLSSITAGGADLGKTRTLHGMTMFIGWSTLVSLGIMVARYARKYEWWIVVHQRLQQFGTAGTVSGVLVAFSMVQNQLASPHAIIGMTIAFGTAVQAFIGGTVHENRFNRKRGQLEPRIIKVFAGIHRNLGKILMVISLTNIMLGIGILWGSDRWEYQVVMVYCFGVVGLFVLLETQHQIKQYRRRKMTEPMRKVLRNARRKSVRRLPLKAREPTLRLRTKNENKVRRQSVPMSQLQELGEGMDEDSELVVEKNPLYQGVLQPGASDAMLRAASYLSKADAVAVHDWIDLGGSLTQLHRVVLVTPPQHRSQRMLNNLAMALAGAEMFAVARAGGGPRTGWKLHPTFLTLCSTMRLYRHEAALPPPPGVRLPPLAQYNASVVPKASYLQSDPLENVVVKDSAHAPEWKSSDALHAAVHENPLFSMAAASTGGSSPRSRGWSESKLDSPRAVTTPKGRGRKGSGQSGLKGGGRKKKGTHTDARPESGIGLSPPKKQNPFTQLSTGVELHESAALNPVVTGEDLRWLVGVAVVVDENNNQVATVRENIQPEHRFTSRRPRRAELLRRLYEAIDAAHSKLPEQQLGPTDNHLDPLAHKKLHFSLAQLNANLRLFPEYNKFSLRWVVAPFVVLKGYVTVAFVAQEESVSPVSQAAPLHVVRKKTVHAGDGWLYNGPAIEQRITEVAPDTELIIMSSRAWLDMVDPNKSGGGSFMLRVTACLNRCTIM